MWQKGIGQHVISSLKLKSTHDTGVIIQHKVLPLKHGSGVKAIVGKQPKKTTFVFADNSHPTSILRQGH
jgi:hypothetical protein